MLHRYLNIKGSNIARLLLCVVLVSSCFVTLLHSHFDERNVELSDSHHDIECVLCEMGLGSGNSIAFSFVATEILASKFTSSTNLYAFSHNSLLSITFSARAPPAN
jgi:hypothetical protein